MAYENSQDNSNNGECTSLDAGSKIVIGGREYSKHIVHWYDDGNIGFLVGGMAFFIHRGVISRKSSVMKALINTSIAVVSDNSAPPYEQLSQTILGGVPLIRLAGEDTAEDFVRVLDFIYPETLPFTPSSELTTNEIMGLVRFTHRYLIQDLKAWAVSKLETSHLLQVQDKWDQGTLQSCYSSNPSFCVDVIQFAHECNLHQFLALEFYALSTMEWNNLPLEAAQCLERLSSTDRCRILRGYSAMIKAVKEKGVNMYENGITQERCPEGEETCDAVWTELWSTPQHRWTNLILHPLEELEFIMTRAQGESLCVECYTELHTDTREFRDELIASLPIFFQLDY